MLIAILLISVAGIMNGSFALPIKHIPKWKFENIWLNFAIWTMVILPWAVALYFEPRICQIYAKTPINLWAITMIGGCLFGVGQVCFALAIETIGIGLGFVVNLGVGIGLGSALPLFMQHPQKILTLFGLITLIGTILAIIGLILSNYAGALRDRHINTATSLSSQTQKNHSVGLLLAIFAGIGSAIQNITFSSTQSMQSLALAMGANSFAAANIIWPIFLLCTALPYILYMLYRHYKNHSFSAYRQKNIGKYYLFAPIMSILSYGSLLLYCKAAQLIGSQGAIIGWPIFMVLIILTSTFWSWRYHEWKNCGKQAESTMKLGIIFLITAVIVLGYSAML